MTSSISLESRLSFVLLLSLPQFFVVKVMGMWLPLALVAVVLLFPELIIRFRELVRDRTVLLLMGLMATQCFALTGSVDKAMGVKVIVYEAVFIVVFLAAKHCDWERLKKQPAMWIFFIGCFLLAGFVIICRIFPELEDTFLLSGWSGIFINPNVQQGLADGSIRNNVFDPVKAGGIFVNANVASCYLGMLSLCTLACIRRPRLAWGISLPLLVAVFSTGSKTATVILIGLTIVYLVVALVLRNILAAKMALALGVMVASMMILFYSPIPQQFVGKITSQETSLAPMLPSASPPSSDEPGPRETLDNAEDSMNSRLLIWQYGLEAFEERPLMGQGYGGWQQGFSSYVKRLGEEGIELRDGFPPHNTFIYLWSQSGALSVVFAALLLLYWSGISLSAIGKNREKEHGLRMAMALTGAWVWLTVHGMGDNTGLLGDAHQVTLLAVIIAGIDNLSERKRASAA
ncbi:O-antigen ligase family protein [Salinicola lusitanus]|uniref:O-antigen ligase family protein n=1 Tax=Salinicola lusitanus TaxID=1949085 RepID=UPI000DA18578|nr:O-antigen ligase family protein [Salinicola lusitanus]